LDRVWLQERPGVRVIHPGSHRNNP
jgi:hypothetical protein